MKRYNNLFDDIISIENIKLAHKFAKRGKAKYRDVKLVNKHPELLNKIQESLANETYEVSNYKISIINDKKERELYKLPYYPDRIIQWAIMLKLEPIFLKTFHKHCCASVPKRGIKAAYDLSKSYAKQFKYCLKLDVRKYYQSIDHSILKSLYRKKIKDQRLLRLLDKIVDSYPGTTGLPIGSYLSQYFANFYLTFFDHKLASLNPHFVRYMDDICIYSNSKEGLWDSFQFIKREFEKLKLTIKPNYCVKPVSCGIDFVGFVFHPNYIRLRKSTKQRFVRSLKKLNIRSFNAYYGFLKMCNSSGLTEKHVVPRLDEIMGQYTECVKNPKKHSKYKSKLLSLLKDNPEDYILVFPSREGYELIQRIQESAFKKKHKGL